MSPDDGTTSLEEIQSQFPVMRLKFGVDRKTDKFETVPDQISRVSLDMVESGTGNVMENGEEETNLSTGLVEFQEGDVLFNKLRPYLAKAFKAEYRGAGSPEFLVLRPTQFNARFLLYLLLSDEFIERVDASTYGAKMPRASWDFIGDLRVPCPDVRKQEEIADFLDDHTARIDALIEKKERLQKALVEKRQAVITLTVTKGLEPSTEMVESSIPGVREIPSHWGEVKTGWMIHSLQNGWSPNASSRPAKDNEYGVLKLSAVSKGTFQPGENKAIEADTQVDNSFLIERGDVLVTRANTPELVADACTVDKLPRKLIAPDLIFIIKVDQNRLEPRYLSEWLITPPARAQVRLDAHGSSESMVKVSQSNFKGWKMPLPPKAEQSRILSHIHEIREDTQKLYERLGGSINLLKEKRQALITAAVTGQIDVAGGPKGK